jgi:hypothetical protein
MTGGLSMGICSRSRKRPMRRPKSPERAAITAHEHGRLLPLIMGDLPPLSLETHLTTLDTSILPEPELDADR